MLSVAAKGDESLDDQYSMLLQDGSEAVAAAEQTMAETLNQQIPPKKGEKEIITSDGRRVLLGDLFKCGKAVALVELIQGGGESNGEIGLGFASWNGAKWEPRGLWKISPTWRPAGWQQSEEERFPVTPATKPFWTLMITPDKPPLIIVAGDIWKYWQEKFIFRFDAKSSSLKLLEVTKSPYEDGGYLCITYDSGHRATFVAHKWCWWTGEKLVPKAYWYDGMDEKEENNLLKAETYDARGNRTDSYEVQSDQMNNYEVSRNGRPIAKVSIVRPSSPEDESEKAYLFEKLTGLPRKLYPGEWPEAKRKRLEDVAKITVTGTPEGVKKLSPKKFFWQRK